MRQKLCKNLLSVLIALCMICGIAVPISQTISSNAVYAAGYGSVNAKATTCKIAATGGGDFLLKQNTATITFKMNKNCQVRVYVMDTDDTIIWYKDVSGVKAKKSYTVKWNGKNKSGKYVSISGSYKKYRVCVRAGRTKTYSSYIKLFKKSDFAGGVGSEEDPYQVETVEQFTKIGKHANRYFKQVANINFNLKKVDIIQTTFTGTYDGNGYTIKYAVFSGDNDIDTGYNTTGAAAMFYEIGEKGVVKNVTFDECKAESGGFAAIVAYNNFGLIKGCKFTDTKVNASINGRTVGNTCAATICISNKSTGKIKNCVLSGVCSVDGNFMIGGIAYSNSGTIDSVTGEMLYVTSGGFAGGIVEWNNETGVIKNCTLTGGVIGYYYYGQTEQAAGLAIVNSGSIQNSVFNGARLKIYNDHSRGPLR